MIKYIYDICKKKHCSVDLCIGPDGSMRITVFGRHTDSLIIGANWSEETIKDCIEDTVRRACSEYY